MTGIKIKLPKTFKISKDGKVEFDHKAAEAKLDVSTRLKRRNSKKVKVKTR